MNINNIKTIESQFLVELGFPKATAQKIIRQTKKKWYNKGTLFIIIDDLELSLLLLLKKFLALSYWIRKKVTE